MIDSSWRLSRPSTASMNVYNTGARADIFNFIQALVVTDFFKEH